MTKPGFTIIEIVVVIVITAILATIAVLGYGRYQDQSRDAQRMSNITVITESLEKYYDEKGWYPSCATMTSAALTVSNVLDIDERLLQAPRDSAENSFTCTSLSAGNDLDKYAYIGDTSTDCATGDSCLEWVIQYRSDELGQIYSVESRR